MRSAMFKAVEVLGQRIGSRYVSIGTRERVAFFLRAQSSTAELVLGEDDEDRHFTDVPLLDEQQQMVQRTRRPRLEALREQLRSASEARSPNETGKIRQATQSTKGCSASDSSSVPFEENVRTIQRIISELKQIRARDIEAGSRVEEKTPSTLTDRFGRYHTYLRISLTERCNLRCQYCMPPEGVPLQAKDSILDTDEILQLVSLFASKGVNKIRLTGGEPLLRPDIVPLIQQISSSHPEMKSVGITTNGLILGRKLDDLIHAGLTHANISLDTLKEDKFLEITRRKGLAVVLDAIERAALMLPKGRVKVNCVVMKGFNDDELKDFVSLAKQLPVDVRFIEWMPFNDNGWNANRFFSYEDMLDRIQDSDNTVHSEEKISLIRATDAPNDTTKWYNVPGYEGRVGFITSMSDHFCGTCNRLRITADGQLKVCLFGSDEVSLRDAMRAGIPYEDMLLLVEAAVKKKKFALGGHGDMHGIKSANNNRPMTLIGG